MAEYISMKQVPGGTVTSVDDRILYDINLTNGKIYGCEVSYLGNNMIHINAGYGVIKGGLFEIEDHTEYVDFAESEPTPGQIYLHFDAAAQDKLTIVKETSANAHQLVQNEDANYESGVYEIQICTFTATTTALTDVTETWPTASGAMETLGTMEEVMANTEAGKVADALVTKQLNSNLTANNQSFRYAYQDGKYGHIVREADTDVFYPFSQVNNVLIAMFGGIGHWNPYDAPLGDNGFYNDELCERNGIANFTVNFDGTVKCFYSSSYCYAVASDGQKNIIGYTKVEKYHNGTWTTVGAEISRNSTNVAEFDVQQGDIVRVLTSNGGHSGYQAMYSATFFKLEFNGYCLMASYALN